MPRVSVIIPTYNRAHSIERALQSAQNQTLKDIEILICDDVSTDSTKELIQTYIKHAPRIKWLSALKNQGPGASRNLGMKTAQGDYIAFLDSDDEWLPEKLGKQVERMDSEPLEVGVCFCGAKIIKYGTIHRTVFYKPKKSWEYDTLRKYVMNKIDFVTPIILFRRNCLTEAGMMAEFRESEDDEFLLRLFFHFKLAVIPEVYAVIHLDTSWNKNAYEYKTIALENYLRNHEPIRQKLGWWAAIYFKGRRYTDLLLDAIRERKHTEAGRMLKKRLQLFPWLWPDEIISIIRAFLRTLFQPR